MCRFTFAESLMARLRCSSQLLCPIRAPGEGEERVVEIGVYREYFDLNGFGVQPVEKSAQ
jgi:hypothetical protein